MSLSKNPSILVPRRVAADQILGMANFRGKLNPSQGWTPEVTRRDLCGRIFTKGGLCIPSIIGVHPFRGLVEISLADGCTPTTRLGISECEWGRIEWGKSSATTSSYNILNNQPVVSASWGSNSLGIGQKLWWFHQGRKAPQARDRCILCVLMAIEDYRRPKCSQWSSLIFWSPRYEYHMAKHVYSIRFVVSPRLKNSEAESHPKARFK